MSASISVAPPAHEERAFATSTAAIDDTAMLVAGNDHDTIDPQAAEKLRKKIDLYLLPLMMREFYPFLAIIHF